MVIPQRYPASASLRQKQHYDRVAEGYDTVRKNLQFMKMYYGHLNNMLLGYLPKDRCARILDNLCGSGNLLTFLCTRYEWVGGLDISEEMLRRVDRKSCRNARLFCGDTLFLPFKDNIFDAVTIRGGLHHVPNVEKALAEIYRVLKKGGVLAIHEACDDSALVRYFRRLVYRLSPVLDEHTEQGLLSAELSLHLRALGLRRVAVRKYGFIGYLLLANPDVLTLTKALRLLPGSNILTRILIAFDEWISKINALQPLNLTLIAVAQK